MNSALSKLIPTLRERIQNARKHKRSLTEEDTKVTLITPMIRALGWDVEDFDEVRFEYRHKSPDPPVDYALFHYRVPSLFVEAKSLGTDLKDRKWVSQTIAYASTVGVTWCVLTDGNEYRLYNAHAPVDADEKLFRTLRLEEDNEAEIQATLELLSKSNIAENKLTSLWEAHFVDRQIKFLLESMVTRQDNSLVRLLHKKIGNKGISQGDIKKSLQRANLQLDFPLLVDQTPVQIKAQPVPPVIPPNPVSSPEKDSAKIRLKDIIKAGIIKAPFKLEKVYKKQHLSATVEADGSITFGGERYNSPSLAGGYARNSVSGLPQGGDPYWRTNGWIFWNYVDPVTGEVHVLDHLMKLYLKAQRK